MQLVYDDADDDDDADADADADDGACSVRCTILGNCTNKNCVEAISH